MFKWFSWKKESKKIKEETKTGFELVKKDIASVTGWIKHLDSEKNIHKRDIDQIKEDLSYIKNEIESMKSIISIVSEVRPKQVFKTQRALLDKQTPVYSVQTGVQTGVQTPNLEQFSITERAILWILLNAEIKLGYDDLSAILGKEKSTIRGQINTIKSKSEGLIEEAIEKNGKKRIYIPEEIKEKMLKKSKVRVGVSKNKKKQGQNDEK